MEFWVGVTDKKWYDFLANLKPDEVNFWQPSGTPAFKKKLELFLFKLHSPLNYIVGGGYFVTYTNLPISLAWETFEEKNGVSSYSALRNIILEYKKSHGRTRETPISNWPTLTYGLQETHTTILPYKGFVGIVFSEFAGTKLELRLNAPYDNIMTTTVASLTSNTTGVLSKGLNEVNGPTSATTFGTYTFPLEHTAGASINDGPAWRDYWAEIYEKYAVIGCKYKIIIKNACLGNRGFLVAYEMDSYKNGSTGNKMPDAPYANIVQFKGIKYKNVDPYSVDNTGNYTAIIEGTYKPWIS